MAEITSKNWVSIGSDAVLSLFALGGSFLLNALPEMDSKSYIIGIAQIGSLLIFLFINFFLIKAKKAEKFFIRLALFMAIIFVISAIAYYNFRKANIKFIIKENIQVVKGELNRDVIQICNNAKITLDECEDWYLSIITSDKLDKVWLSRSVNRNTNIIILFYSVVVFSLSCSLFSIIELLNKATPTDG